MSEELALARIAAQATQLQRMWDKIETLESEVKILTSALDGFRALMVSRIVGQNQSANPP